MIKYFDRVAWSQLATFYCGTLVNRLVRLCPRADTRINGTSCSRLDSRERWCFENPKALLYRSLDLYSATKHLSSHHLSRYASSPKVCLPRSFNFSLTKSASCKKYDFSSIQLWQIASNKIYSIITYEPIGQWPVRTPVIAVSFKCSIVLVIEFTLLFSVIGC